MMRPKLLRGVLIPGVLFLSLVSCKDANYLFIKPQPVVKAKAQPVSSSYKLKNLIGNNQVDILWVIDNSGSMATYQQSVANNTSLFINTLAKNNTLNWKMGLISTDIGDQPYLGLAPGTELDSSSPDRVNPFIQAVAKLGTSGDPVEKTFDPVMKELSAFPGFLRPKAQLAIILVSDAPEQSKVTTSDFVSYLRQAKGGTDSILFYGILCPHDWCEPTDDEWELNGSKFQELGTLIKSKMFPICDSNFGQHLLDIGNDIVLLASHPKAYLNSIPQVQTLRVLYKGKEIPGGTADKGGFWLYDYEINAVVFHDLSFAPGNDEEVEVEYQPVETP